ncbi:hypothetical protein F4801DRAFT_602279 [Xylaria longipes]|nr:hypothetical protein F4801DRAFT_602279 [Xylaria longipes]
MSTSQQLVAAGGGPALEKLWNGAELDEQEFPAFGAWKEKEDEIDRHLEDAVKTPGVTVLSLTSNPATGKSTTLMRHISERAMASKAPRRVLYVVATEIEARYISAWLFAHKVLDTTSAGVGGVRGVQVVTTKAMVEMFTERRTIWPDHLTIAFDINWYPTVDDEMALALVLHRACQVKESDHVHMAIVLLMSGFESTRTIQAFRKRLGDISQVILDQHHHYPGVVRLEGSWREDVRGNIGNWNGEGRMVVGGRMADVDSWRGLGEDGPCPIPEPQDPTVSRGYTLEENLETLDEEAIIVARGEVPFALGLGSVRLVICTGEIGHVARFDAAISQTVIYNRRMMLPEILRVFSWGIRSDQYGAGVGPVFADAAPGLEEAAEPDRDDLGHAWNRDLSFLILNIFKVWPGLELCRLPTRDPLDTFSFTDRIRGLEILGCLEGQGEGWKCSELGMEILKVRGEMGPTLGFNVAFLLARVVLMRRHSGHRNPLVARVLIHMAAIAHRGSSEFFAIKQNIDKQTLVRYFPSVIPKDKWYAGSLWAGLGLYLRGCRHLWFSEEGEEEEEEEPTISPIDGMQIDAVAGSFIAKLAQKFAAYTRVPLGKLEDTNWDQASLTEDEIATIDRELMWAWLHRIAMFWPTPMHETDDVVTDVVSFEKFGISMDREAIDAAHLRQESAKQNESGGAFYAIYEALVDGGRDLPAEGRRRRYTCQDVTYIPGTAFGDVEHECGIIWPDAVSRSQFR